VNSIKNIIGFSVYSSVWVAIAVYSLTQITYLNLDIPVDESLLFFIFFGTIPAYNFVKNFERSQFPILKIKPLLVGFNKSSVKRKGMLFMSLFCLLISGFCFLKLQFRTQLFLLVPLLLTVFYTVSFWKKTLRTISGLKIYIIALCWVLITVLLPVFNEGSNVAGDFYVELLQRFLFVIAITLPFEIRDLNSDVETLATIPQKIGVKGTKLLGSILLMLFFFLEFLKDKLLSKENIIVFTIVFILSLLSVLLAKKDQSKFYAGFFVEGIPILWLGLLLLL